MDFTRCGSGPAIVVKWLCNMSPSTQLFFLLDLWGNLWLLDVPISPPTS